METYGNHLKADKNQQTFSSWIFFETTFLCPTVAHSLSPRLLHRSLAVQVVAKMGGLDGRCLGRMSTAPFAMEDVEGQRTGHDWTEKDRNIFQRFPKVQYGLIIVSSNQIMGHRNGHALDILCLQLSSCSGYEVSGREICGPGEPLHRDGQISAAPG